MKKMLVWETLSTVSGGQKMTLQVIDLLKDEYEFVCLIPEKGLLSDALDERGIPFVLLGSQTMPTGVKGRSVIFRYAAMSARCIWKSLLAIRKYKPDILYAPGPAALPWSAICGGIMRKPVVWHLHHIFLDGPTKKLLNMCSKWKSVKKIIAVSNVVGEQIEDIKAHEKVEVIYNPVDIEKYASGDAEKVRAEIEALIGRKIIRGGVILLLQIAAITKNKKQEILIDTVKALNNHGVAAVGLYAGEAITEADRAYKEELQNKIADAEMGKNIFFLGFRSDIPDLLQLVNYVFIPSQEGLSLAALEGMAARTKVIAEKNGGAFELLNAAKCGVCYESKSIPNQIAEIIIENIGTTSKEDLDTGYDFCAELTQNHYKEKIQMLFSNLQ